MEAIEKAILVFLAGVALALFIAVVAVGRGYRHTSTYSELLEACLQDRPDHEAYTCYSLLFPIRQAEENR